jgi:hypothetical protein
MERDSPAASHENHILQTVRTPYGQKIKDEIIALSMKTLIYCKMNCKLIVSLQYRYNKCYSRTKRKYDIPLLVSNLHKTCCHEFKKHKR